MKKEINQTGFSQPILLGAIILLLLILGGIYFLSTRENQEKTLYQGQLQISNKPSPAFNKEATSSEKEKIEGTINQQATPLQKVFTSKELGIEFTYLEKTPLNKVDTVKTKVVGNKVYVYFKEENFEKGQYVEVFNKDPNDNLKTAINKQILKNYSEENCSTDISKSSSYLDSYEEVYVSYAKSLLSDGFVGTNDVDKCPTKYISYQGKAIFVTDKKHPDKFVFFSIGQYGIEAGDGKFWEETIKFLN